MLITLYSLFQYLKTLCCFLNVYFAKTHSAEGISEEGKKER